jgi:hypothetical protein
MGYLWQRVVDTIRSPWPIMYHHRELDHHFADVMNFVQNIILLREIDHFNKIWVIYGKELLIPSGVLDHLHTTIENLMTILQT